MLERHCADGRPDRRHRRMPWSSSARASSTKTPILLRAAAAPAAYVPIDISRRFPARSHRGLAGRGFPRPADPPGRGRFHEADRASPRPKPVRKLGFFPGSTIGNLVAATGGRPAPGDEAHARHRRLSFDRHGPGQGCRRSCSAPMTTRPASPPPSTSTCFVRINRELDGDIPVDAFRHRAIWNERRAGSRCIWRRSATSPSPGRRHGFRDVRRARRSTPRTATNMAFATARLLLRAAGWGLVEEWTDADDQLRSDPGAGRGAALRALTGARAAPLRAPGRDIVPRAAAFVHLGLLDQPEARAVPGIIAESVPQSPRPRALRKAGQQAGSWIPAGVDQDRLPSSPTSPAGWSKRRRSMGPRRRSVATKGT